MTFEVGLGIGISVGIIVALLTITSISVMKIASNLGSIKKEVKGIKSKLEEV